MSYTSRNNASSLPQGFSIYQPTLGAHLQFLPAIGTPELDELINAYVPGSATTQEKRASVSLDFLEYAHATGQTFKFYPVYSVNAAVESPATDSGYGSSFNASPVTSSWDFSQISTSRSPPSQQARKSPKTAPSRQQAADFANLPGMKIMTKDGRDVTNSASRGSKTKEQRDHAHLMRIIKACDSCRRKKIRCDPSHKKRAAPQSQPQSATKSTKKTKAVAQAVQATAAPPPVDVPVEAPDMALDPTFAPIDLEGFTSSLSALEPWEEFIQYPPADVSDEYDFFNDPAGYFSPVSASSSVSACSTKPVTPNSQQELSAPYSLPGGETTMVSPQLPFNQAEPTSNYVDFNLFSPDSSFSEDEQMVPIEMSRYITSHSHSPQSGIVQSDQSVQSPDSLDVGCRLIGSALDVASWSVSSRGSGEDDSPSYGPYRDPGADDQGHDYSPSSSLSSDGLTQSDGLTGTLGSIEPTSGPLASSNVAYAVASDSAATKAFSLAKSPTRRGTDMSATVVAYTETAAGSSDEDRISSDVNLTHDDRMSSASSAMHTVNGISLSASSEEQHVLEHPIAAPRTPRFIDRDVSEHVVAANSSATTIVTTNATTKATNPSIAAHVSSSHPLEENSLGASGAKPQPDNQHAPCSPVTGGDNSLLPLVSSAGLAGTVKSSVGVYIVTMLSTILAFAAIASWFQRSYNTSAELPFGSSSDVEVGGKTSLRRTMTKSGPIPTFWNRARSFESESLCGTLSVSRMIARSSSLVVV